MTAAQHNTRIMRLASDRRVHAAFRSLHLGERERLTTQCELSSIPSPPFAETARAAAVAARLRTLGYHDVSIDEAGNVLAPTSAMAPADAQSPVLLLSAHLDTIFPVGTDVHVRHDVATGYMYGAGITDNAAGLAALLALAGALKHAALMPAVPILFAANTGEEGPGNLRGMRHLFSASPWASRIRAALALEGSGVATVVDRALGSRRYRLTVAGPGGHSWADAGRPNPVLALARALAAVDAAAAALPSSPRSTCNVGLIGGGTAVNAVPANAFAELDLRSATEQGLRSLDAAVLTALRTSLTQAGVSAVHADAPTEALTWQLTLTGERPAAELPHDTALMGTLRAVDRHLQIATDLRIGSTDANLPLSLGVPAVALGCGGSSAGIHTLGEWFHPAGTDVAMRRLLLIALATAEQLADAGLGA